MCVRCVRDFYLILNWYFSGVSIMRFADTADTLFPTQPLSPSNEPTITGFLHCGNKEGRLATLWQRQVTSTGDTGMVVEEKNCKDVVETGMVL